MINFLFSGLHELYLQLINFVKFFPLLYVNLFLPFFALFVVFREKSNFRSDYSYFGVEVAAGLSSASDSYPAISSLIDVSTEIRSFES